MSSKKQKLPDRKKMEKEYESGYSLNERILYDLQKRLNEDIKNMPLNATIKTRIKSFESYYNKLLKRLKKYENRDEAFSINDLLGIRIACPFQENMKVIESFINDNYEIMESENKGVEFSFKEFGYASIHYVIKVPSNILESNNVEGEKICEIQLCTTLQDAWAEVEHELIYKSEEFSPFDEPLKRKLAALNANLTLADILFQEILDYQKKLKLELKLRKVTFFKKVDAETVFLSSDSQAVGNSIKKESRSSFDINPNQSVDDILLSALEAHNSNRYLTAISMYSHILKLNLPLNIQVIVYIHRGMACFAESEYDQSILDFSSAVELDKDNHKALFYRGIVQKVLQNYQLALQDLTRCITITPYTFSPYFNRAQVYYHMNDYTEALADCEQALKIEPDSHKAQKLREYIKAGIEIMNNY